MIKLLNALLLLIFHNRSFFMMSGQKRLPAIPAFSLFVLLTSSLLFSACSAPTPPPYTPIAYRQTVAALTTTPTFSSSPSPISTRPTRLSTATLTTRSPSASPSPSQTTHNTATLPAITASMTATANLAPTAVPTLGLADQSLSGWCLPTDAAVQPISLAGPSYANKATFTNGALEVNNLPASACYVFFLFNQPITKEQAQGMQLQLFDAGSKKAWFSAPLSLTPDDPHAAGAIISHTVFVTPTTWNYSFEIGLKDATGNIVIRVPVHLHHWAPQLCANGQYPDIKTMTCP
jgi:hypothetical protein